MTHTRFTVNSQHREFLVVFRPGSIGPDLGGRCRAEPGPAEAVVGRTAAARDVATRARVDEPAVV